MWKKLKFLLVILSVAFNIAFITVWLTHVLAVEKGNNDVQKDKIECPMHRQLGTTEKQWEEIEPNLLEFRKSARSVCEEISRSRTELIDLLAAPEPDLEKIREKREKILTGQNRMQKLVINWLLKEKKILTPDQQKMLFFMLRRQSGCAGHGPIAGQINAGESCHRDKTGNPDCHKERRKKH